MVEWGRDERLAVAILLLTAIGLLLLTIIVLTVFFCLRRRSDWNCDGASIVPRPVVDASSINDAFDFQDETTPYRIEERRIRREKQLAGGDVDGELTLDRIDKNAAAALAVEQLLRDSYVFDTRILEKPPGDIQVIAAKRDYL